MPAKGARVTEVCLQKALFALSRLPWLKHPVEQMRTCFPGVSLQVGIEGPSTEAEEILS